MNDEIPMTKEDIYGQRHPIENPDLVEEKIFELDGELALLLPEQKQGWIQAQEKCDPSLIGDDFKLLFLRCEVFNCEVSCFVLSLVEKNIFLSLFVLFSYISLRHCVLPSTGISVLSCLVRKRHFYP